MTDNPDLWEVRRLPGSLALELWGGGNPALVLVQGKRRVVVDLPHVKTVAAALTDGAADLAELLAADDTLQSQIDTMVKADPPCLDNANRYVDCGNGTVHDTMTNLIWLKKVDCYGQLDYAAANNAAAGLEDGECGLTDGSSPGDWRLPTREEWEATMARAAQLPCAVPPSEPPYLTNTPGTDCYHAGPKAFTGVQPDYYWASTSFEDFPNSADFAVLDAGFVSTWAPKANALHVWPVRGGQ